MDLFTELQTATLLAAIDRIVPADDFPGASEAGVMDFLFDLLPKLGTVELYRKGLDSLEALTQSGGHQFSDASSETMDATLADPVVRKFVNVLVQQTMEGYYTSHAGLACVGFKVTA